MVADDEVDAERLGVGYLFNGFDTTVENDDEFHACLLGVVDAFLANAVAFVVAVGDVILYVGVELLYELVHQCYRSASVHVVVAVNKDALLATHRVVEAVDGEVHVLHEEGVDEVCQLRVEESLGS